jgi:23S rRNA (guanosine2251-2'-O)-methyltransferase
MVTRDSRRVTRGDNLRATSHESRVTLFIYGKHAATAALANSMRKVKRVLVTKNAQAELFSFPSPLRGEGQGGGDWLKKAQIVDSQKIDAMLPPGSVHQGIAVECEPLAQPGLQEWLSEEHPHPTTLHPHPNPPPSRGRGIIMLDQVTDPHNVGAILRTAAAFGIGAVVTLERSAAQESGVMAKAASGALELVPLISVGNLAQAIAILKKAGYWIYGLDGEAKASLCETKFDAKTALILGAEGRGLRRLTAEHCDFLVKIPMSGQMESLNVSNAAAVALYALTRG